jgi:hypothetical protein
MARSFFGAGETRATHPECSDQLAFIYLKQDPSEVEGSGCFTLSLRASHMTSTFQFDAAPSQ